jgi:hypothetical protein
MRRAIASVNLKLVKTGIAFRENIGAAARLDVYGQPHPVYSKRSLPDALQMIYPRPSRS